MDFGNRWGAKMSDEAARPSATRANAYNGEDVIVRTERGLSLKGTRKTLYSILDYVHAGWPPKLIKDWLDLSDAQITGAMADIESHRQEVEREYQEVIRQGEEIRKYWEEYNRNRPKRAKTVPDSPKRAALREKLEAWKKSLNNE